MKCVFLILFFTITYCSNAQQQKITIEFKHVVGTKKLNLFSDTFFNTFKEPFIVNRFKYYVSNFCLVYQNNKVDTITNSYFLIDEADSTSKTISLPINHKKVKAIYFNIGVDSLRNCSGVQTDALDPMNGMFWTWNTGYVFAKLEGKSSVSTAPSNYFTYHIGGYKKNENALQKIKLLLNSKKAIRNNTITIQANILAWFSSVKTITIKDNPVCHQPGELALKIANNYCKMFTIISSKK